MGVRSKIFSDFGLILGPHFESFLSSDGLNFVFLLELASRSLLASTFGWNYWQLELLEQGFRVQGIAQNMFGQKSFFGDSKVDLLCFLEALGTGFLTFSARLEN